MYRNAGLAYRLQVDDICGECTVWLVYLYDLVLWFTISATLFAIVMRYRIFLQAREEYRIMKYHKQVEWAVGVIKRQYVQWKVCEIASTGTHLLTLFIFHSDVNSCSRFRYGCPLTVRVRYVSSGLSHLAFSPKRHNCCETFTTAGGYTIYNSFALYCCFNILFI